MQRDKLFAKFSVCFQYIYIYIVLLNIMKLWNYFNYKIVDKISSVFIKKFINRRICNEIFKNNLNSSKNYKIYKIRKMHR